MRLLALLLAILFMLSDHALSFSLHPLIAPRSSQCGTSKLLEHHKQRTISGGKRCGSGQRGTTLRMAIVGPVRYSSNDWLECLITLPTSRMLKRVKKSLLFQTLWTTAFVFFYKYLKAKYSYPTVVHSILGSALGLLLVFRTNASYDRFWEGRKLWTTAIAACRDIATRTSIHIGKGYHREIACVTLTYMLALRQHLHGEKTDEEIAPFLQDYYNVSNFQSYRNPPAMALRLLAQVTHKALHETYPDGTEAALHEQGFEEAIHSLNSAGTCCERLLKQPIPSDYSRHTSRFLTLYLMTLPLSLIASLGWYTIPTMLFISWSFMSIQEIGYFIEEPFNKQAQLIPMAQLISVVRSDMSEILDGVISSPVFEKLDAKMLAGAKARSRMRDDSYFAYY